MNTPKEFEASIKRAFVDREAESVIIDSLHERFLIEAAMWGKNQGWLIEEYHEPPPWPSQDGGTLEYKLTDKGKEHFGL